MFLSEDELRRVAALLFHLLKKHWPVNGNGERQPAIAPRLLTVAQAAEYYGRSKSAVEHLINRRKLPGCIVKRDGRVMVDRVALDRLIESDKV